jgi:hypothetical protein
MSKNNLKKYVDKFFDELTLSQDSTGHNFKDILKANIHIFLDYESSYNALNIYETFLSIYQITSNDENSKKIINEANILLDCVKVMFKYENMRKQRHYNSLVHSVNVLLLGLAVYAQNKNFKKIFKENIKESPYENYYRIENEISDEEFLYRWGITSLFQNIALNIETLGKSLQKLITDELNTHFNSHGETININLINLEKLNSINILNNDFADQYKKTYPETKFLDLFKPTDLLTHKLSLDFNLTKRQQDYLKNKIEDLLIDCPCKEYNTADHGIISSIIILDLYGYLIQKYENDSNSFFYPILNSANAILLKNVYRNILQKNPFNLKLLNAKQNPLGFLLILCNELVIYVNPPIAFDENNHKIDLDLDINDNSLYITYIVKKGRLHFNPNDTKYSLDYILDIKNIFNDDLIIKTEIETDNNVMREKQISGLNSPNLPMDLIYKLAKGIHEQYNQVVRDSYFKAKEKMNDDIQKAYDNLCEFDDLPLDLKITNIRLARLIPKELNFIGYELAYKSDERKKVTEFSQEESHDVAILKHDEWCNEKRETGWKYGPIKSEEKSTHPCLVDWNSLNKDLQENNINTAKNIPSLIGSINLKIVPTKKRQLSQEMHDFYMGYDEENSFDKLPNEIKYYNFRHMDSYIKRLKKLNYKIVEKEDEGTPIDGFEKNEIEYLSKEEHKEWMMNKINLGWTCGPQKDENKKTNPSLVPWEDLDPKIQEETRNTYKNFTTICDNVGLKVIKE